MLERSFEAHVGGGYVYLKAGSLDAYVGTRSKAECSGHQFDFFKRPGCTEVWLPGFYMSVSWPVRERDNGGPVATLGAALDGRDAV
jgi:hypothetical protein